jgi:hypothetical protein
MRIRWISFYVGQGSLCLLDDGDYSRIFDYLGSFSLAHMNVGISHVGQGSLCLLDEADLFSHFGRLEWFL